MGVFWYWFKTFIWKNYSKSKQTKYSGFVKLGVRWAEQDTSLSICQVYIDWILEAIVLQEELFSLWELHCEIPFSSVLTAQILKSQLYHILLLDFLAPGLMNHFLKSDILIPPHKERNTMFLPCIQRSLTNVYRVNKR